MNWQELKQMVVEVVLIIRLVYIKTKQGPSEISEDVLSQIPSGALVLELLINEGFVIEDEKEKGEKVYSLSESGKIAHLSTER